MKHPFRKLLALGLSVVLTAALLPAASATQVTGAELRAAAVAQAQAIATVPWTIEGRVIKTNVTGERLDLFHAGGILPTTYFEYVRLQFPIRGVMVENNTGTLDAFKAQLDPAQSKAEGYPHLNSTTGTYVGMDVNAFVADVLSRVSPTKITGLKQALTDPSLEALLPGTNLSAPSSKAAIGSANVKAAYDKMGPGDLLLAWDNNSVTGEGGQPRIHAMVVQSVDAAKDTATVIYPNYALMVYHFECDKCGTKSTEGPTSAALPNHLNSVNYAFGSFKKHSDTYPNAGCDGTWKPIHATGWTVGTVSFAELAETGVTYGSVGYLPYTLDVYSAPVEPKVSLSTSVTANSVSAGFSGTITSNYHIAGVEAVLSSKSGTSSSFLYPTTNVTKTLEYNDYALSSALAKCEPGSYELELKVLLGNTDREASAFAPISVYKQAFTVSPYAFRVNCNKTEADQGEPFTVSITSLDAGVTAVQSVTKFDADVYAFDLAASKAASPNVTFTQNGNMITSKYLGKALGSGSVVANLVFAPIRTGGWGFSEGIEPFFISGVLMSKQADGGNLVSSSATGSGFWVNVGLNTQVFRNFAAGYDLLLAYMTVPEMLNKDGVTALPLAYDGKPMYDVSYGQYRADGKSGMRTYAYIAANIDSAKVALGTQACPIITYSNNINQTGGVDIADVQTIANIRGGRLPLTGNETKWFLADIDRSGVVDDADQMALIRVMNK